MILLYSVFTLAPHICSDGPANYQFRFRTVAIDLDWHYTKLGPNLGHRVEYTVPCVRAIISGCCRLVVLSAKPQYTFAPSAMKCQDLSKYWKLRSPSWTPHDMSLDRVLFEKPDCEQVSFVSISYSLKQCCILWADRKVTQDSNFFVCFSSKCAACKLHLPKSDLHEYHHFVVQSSDTRETGINPWLPHILQAAWEIRDKVTARHCGFLGG